MTKDQILKKYGGYLQEFLGESEEEIKNIPKIELEDMLGLGKHQGGASSDPDDEFKKGGRVKGAKGGLVRQFKGGGKVRIF